jgi:TRAP-type C4-dicarboxylate transport system permease small subunit
MEQSKNRETVKKIGQALEKVIFPFSKWMSVVSMIASVAMMLLITVDVFMRRLLNSPILGSYEIGKVLLVIVVFFGVAYVMTIKGHVIVDTLTRLYPKKWQIIVSGIANFLSLLIVALICWQSAVYGFHMLEAGETSVLLRILVGPFILIVAFGCAALFLVILVQFIYTLAGIDVDSDSTSCAC